MVLAVDVKLRETIGGHRVEWHIEVQEGKKSLKKPVKGWCRVTAHLWNHDWTEDGWQRY